MDKVVFYQVKEGVELPKPEKLFGGLLYWYKPRYKFVKYDLKSSNPLYIFLNSPFLIRVQENYVSQEEKGANEPLP